MSLQMILITAMDGRRKLGESAVRQWSHEVGAHGSD
jgi:hypothetical protein